MIDKKTAQEEKQATAKGIHNPLQRFNALGGEAYSKEQQGSDTTCKDIEALEGGEQGSKAFQAKQ